MACCTNNIWTKVISSLTIIFCVAYIVLQILILVLYEKKDNYKDNDILNNIVEYIKKGDNERNVQILFYFSISINALWIITSIVLLIFIRKTENQDYSIKEQKKLLKSYITWNVIAFLTFVPDIVCIVIFGLYYFEHDGKDKKGSLYLLILSSRFIVILTFHLISWIGMIIITADLKKSFNDDGSQPVKRTVPLKPLKPVLKPSKVPHLEETNIDRVRDWYKHYEGENNNNSNNSKYYEPNVGPNYIPRLNGNNNNNLPFTNNQNYGLIKPPPVPIKPPKPPAPVAPPSVGHQVMPGMNTNVLVNGVPSGTLRRQLPWSYMPIGGGLPQFPPRKQQSPVSSTVSHFAPYIPAADYNVKNPKPNRRQDFHQPGWNQYL